MGGVSVFQSCYSGPATPTPLPPEDQTSGEQGQHLEHSLIGPLAEDWEWGDVEGDRFGTLLSKAIIKYLISWHLLFFFVITEQQTWKHLLNTSFMLMTVCRAARHVFPPVFYQGLLTLILRVLNNISKKVAGIKNPKGIFA